MAARAGASLKFFGTALSTVRAAEQPPLDPDYPQEDYPQEDYPLGSAATEARGSLAQFGAARSTPRPYSAASRAAVNALAGSATSFTRGNLRATPRLAQAGSGRSTPRPHLSAYTVGVYAATARSVPRSASRAVVGEYIPPLLGWPIATVYQEAMPVAAVGQSYG